MKNAIVRTVVFTSILTAFAASALAYFAMPHLTPVQANSDQGVTLQGQAMNASQPPAGATPAIYYPRPARRTPSAYRPQNAAYFPQESRPVLRDSSGEPITGHQRSTTKSAMIVAGSSAAGAAIGALAKGGKGAAIGAISGGVAGFIFDRLTHNK